MKLKKELPVALAATVANVDDEVNEPSSSEGTIPYNPDDTLPYGMETDDEENIEADPSDDEPEYIQEDDEGELEEENLPEKQPGFTKCWDHAGKKVTTRHPTETAKNKYLNMALGYVAINRSPTSHLEWRFDNTLPKAADLHPDIYIYIYTESK